MGIEMVQPTTIQSQASAKPFGGWMASVSASSMTSSKSTTSYTRPLSEREQRTIFVVNLPEGQKLTGAAFDAKKAKSVLNCLRVQAEPVEVRRLEGNAPRTLKIVFANKTDTETCLRRALYMRDYATPGVSIRGPMQTKISINKFHMGTN